MYTTKVTLQYVSSSAHPDKAVTLEIDIPKQYRNAGMEFTLKIIPTRVWVMAGNNTITAYGIKIFSASCDTPYVFEEVSINP